jgi:hypothetical protein
LTGKPGGALVWLRAEWGILRWKFIYRNGRCEQTPYGACMKRIIALSCLICFLAFGKAYGSPPAPAPSFTISATNITMPLTGGGLIPYSVTSVNGFVGSVSISEDLPSVPAGVLVPVFEGGPVVPPIVLTANSTVKGSVGIYAAIFNVASKRNIPKPGRAASWAMAGALMLGLGLRRRRGRWSGPGVARLLMVAGVLIGLTSISGCGSKAKTLTPGTYTYTITATDVSNNTSSVSTTVQVTVPPGVYVQPFVGPGPV